MANYDERLGELRAKVSRKKQIEAQLGELREQRRELEEKESRLRQVMHAEQADVDRLEKGSLTAFFYYVVGKADEKLTKEREEARGARVKHDAAVSELRLVEHSIAGLEDELDGLRGCEQEYGAVMEEKRRMIRSSGGVNADEMMRLEERIHARNNELRELQEAISAGERARSCARGILSSLDSAHGWGTFDLLGGGLLADVVKHGHLDDAQRQVNELQHALGRFRTELADVSVDANMKVNVDGFLGFADFFFDGLFADWAVMDRIGRSQSQVEGTLRQIETLLGQLRGRKSQAERAAADAKKALDDLVAGTRL